MAKRDANRDANHMHYVQTVACDAEMEVVRRRTGYDTNQYALRSLIEGIIDGSIKPAKRESAGVPA